MIYFELQISLSSRRYRSMCLLLRTRVTQDSLGIANPELRVRSFSKRHIVYTYTHTYPHHSNITMMVPEGLQQQEGAVDSHTHIHTHTI